MLVSPVYRVQRRCAAAMPYLPDQLCIIDPEERSNLTLVGCQTWGLRPTSGKYVLMIDLSSRDPLEKIEPQGPSPKCQHFLQISNSIPIINSHRDV